jgi:hypothetical protein
MSYAGREGGNDTRLRMSGMLQAISVVAARIQLRRSPVKLGNAVCICRVSALYWSYNCMLIARWSVSTSIHVGLQNLPDLL